LSGQIRFSCRLSSFALSVAEMRGQPLDAFFDVNSMKTLDYPNIETDRLIMARFRLSAIEALGVVEPGAVDAPAIFPFRCPPRGYVVQNADEIILVFDPNAVDPRKCVPAFHDSQPPYEVFVLEDAEVIRFFEIRRTAARQTFRSSAVTR